MFGNAVARQRLSEDDLAREEAFLADVPFLNWGAFFMPPIWGIAHGDWPAILFYPLWIFCDNLLYSAWENPSLLNGALACIALAAMALVMVAYARVSSPRAAHRAAAAGDTLERYLRRERRWAVSMAGIALAMLVAATWYNLCIRPTL